LLFTTLSQDGKIIEPASDRVIEFLASIKAWMAAETAAIFGKRIPSLDNIGQSEKFHHFSKLSFFYFTR